MTLTVTLDLPPDVEAELRTSIVQRHAARVRQMLADALMPTVEALLQDTPVYEPSEWDALADQLVDTVTTATPTGLPVLSADATSRAGVYEEHA